MLRPALLAAALLGACGMRQAPTREPILPELAIDPPAPVSYNSRLVELRTTLGRAAIGLEMRGTVDIIRGATCDEPVEDHLQRGCARCELLGENDGLDGAAIEAIRDAFDRYPADVLEATHIEHVALCRTLAYEDIPEERVIGTVDLRQRRLFVSVTPFLDYPYDGTGGLTVEDIIHHELFHLFEYERMREAYIDDPEWRAHNPPSFVYRAEGENEARKAGFVNEYASTTELEDRASVFQYLLAHPDRLCAVAAEDQELRAKTRLVWRRIARLVGDPFLRARATCVMAWLDDDQPAGSSSRPTASAFR